MSNYLALITIAAFIAGMIAGIAATYFGFKIGFMAGAEAWLMEEELPGDKRLFGGAKKEIAEFELLEKNKEGEDND